MSIDFVSLPPQCIIQISFRSVLWSHHCNSKERPCKCRNLLADTSHHWSKGRKWVAVFFLRVLFPFIGFPLAFSPTNIRLSVLVFHSAEAYVLYLFSSMRSIRRQSGPNSLCERERCRCEERASLTVITDSKWLCSPWDVADWAKDVAHIHIWDILLAELGLIWF